MKIAQLYDIYLKHPQVSTDSRSDLENAIFFALKGEHFDGNCFAKQALDQGAAYCIIDDPKAYINKQTIVVENVLATLQNLALHHRRQLPIPVIAITGTNGKTTTKELIHKVLSTTYRTSCTFGNLNNHIGVPLTLLSIPNNAEIAIVEMGANHPGEIDFLCKIAEPDFGLITNIGKAHLEGFGGFEGVLKAKTELYRYLEKRQGTVFVNGDDDMLFLRTGNVAKIFYGSKHTFSISGSIIKSSPFLSVQLIIKHREYEAHAHLIGNYNLFNILAAACIGNYFKVTATKITRAIEEYLPDNMRSQMKQLKSNHIILDAYNANPSSMNEAINNFLEMDVPNKIIILGDMLELGRWSEEEHEKIVKKLVAHKIKRVYFAGKNFNKVSKPKHYLSFSDSETLRDFLKENLPKNSWILIKGSRSVKLEKVLEAFSN
ncbi:MAG: UDP-N-acetylmuramoyl-tripeptide--D-alanyl-D-alanine ligase [Bacteroidales bacterium]|jgi:UDP-N-acetylmuramoyl-tripeptide--D-alanyl-D-alanine ligase|nr:UDP-N-acetylmuramoyl-tripeptide--D-alanyl-D-alanine ligase [Bacteroidales bacterium]